MRSLFLRLSIALLLSLSTLAITLWWYDLTLPKTKNIATGKPIAFVGSIVNDVLKRPADRLLWQKAETNEPLFNGEAIRTPADANAKILFEGSGRILDIEPGSLIVLQRSEGQIALELMEGAIQVAKNQNAETNSTALVLKSESGQIDLSQASASLSKNAKTGLSLEVLEGTASVKTKDGKNQVIKTGESGQINQSGYDIKQQQIKLGKPAKLVEITDALEPVEFDWSGAPEKSTVGLWIGTKRSNMTEILRTQNASAHQELNLNTKYFWKIALYDQQNQIIAESTTATFETRLKISKEQIMASATPVFPKQKTQIPADLFPHPVTFRWTDSVKDSKLTLVLSKSEDLSQPILSRQIVNEKSYNVPLEAGKYFWQLTSVIGSHTKSSPVIEFDVTKSAKLIEQEKRSVQISWSTSENPIRIFYVNDPKIEFSWSYQVTSPQKFNVTSWKVSLKNAATSQTTLHKSAIQKIEIPALSNTGYHAFIQAYDDKDQLVGTSDEREIALTARPLLMSPTVLGESKSPLKANPDGSLQISWQKIPEAKEYELHLLDKDGKIKNKKRYSGTQTFVRNLLPGEYRVRVLAIDQFARASEPLPPKSIIVPEKSGLRAPSSIRTKVQGQRGSQ